MTVNKYATVWCDCPQSHTPNEPTHPCSGWAGQEPTTAEARAEAKQLGWTRASLEHLHDRGDLCSTCTAVHAGTDVARCDDCQHTSGEHLFDGRHSTGCYSCDCPGWTPRVPS